MERGLVVIQVGSDEVPTIYRMPSLSDHEHCQAEHFGSQKGSQLWNTCIPAKADRSPQTAAMVIFG